jgi:hypothetical protein
MINCWPPSHSQSMQSNQPTNTYIVNWFWSASPPRADALGVSVVHGSPLPVGADLDADLDAARGHLDDYCATWVEIEDAGDGRVMMTVNAISPSQSLEGDDRGVMMGEAAEAWFRAVAGT